MDKHILDHYDSAAGAQSYSKKFKRHWNEYFNNWFEQRLVKNFFRRISSSGAKVDMALDCPCGYGRIYPLIKQIASNVVEGDYSSHLLGLAKEAQSKDEVLGPAHDYVQANALDLPFEDQSFDLVFSARLCHHIREAEERQQYVKQIMRVSRNWVLFTYFDQHSFKNQLREFRRKFSSSKRAKWTMTQREVNNLAEANGFTIVKSVPLSFLFSGHRYVLMQRIPPHQ